MSTSLKIEEIYLIDLMPVFGHKKQRINIYICRSKKGVIQLFSARLPAVIEDIQNNKYFFYHTNSAILLKERSYDGSTRDTMLINQVNEPFLVSMDQDNTIYLVCHSRNGELILFSYKEKRWLMEVIENFKYNSHIVLLDMFILDQCIHVLYATSLPLLNFYNIYHLYRVDESFRKTSISEIYSEDLEKSFCAARASNGAIAFVATWSDGKSTRLNFYHYVPDEDKWNHSKVAGLSNSNIRIDLLPQGSKMHLLCHAFEDNLAILFYFQKKSVLDESFEFVTMSKLELDEHLKKPTYFLQEDLLFAEWIYEKDLFRIHFDEDTRTWSDQTLIPFENPPAAVKHLKASDNGVGITIRYLYIDDELNLHSIEQIDTASANEEAIGSNPLEPMSIQSLEELIPYLVRQISTITEDIKTIQTKLTDKPEKIVEMKGPHTPDSETKVNDMKKGTYLRNSKFKEQFMNSSTMPVFMDRPSTINQDLNRKTASKPSGFKERFINGEMKYGGTVAASAYHGTSNTSGHAIGVAIPQIDKKPYSEIVNTEPDRITEAGMLSSSDLPARDDRNEEISPKKDEPAQDKKESQGLLKKLGNFLKQNM